MNQPCLDSARTLGKFVGEICAKIARGKSLTVKECVFLGYCIKKDYIKMTLGENRNYSNERDIK